MPENWDLPENCGSWPENWRRIGRVLGKLGRQRNRGNGRLTHGGAEKGGRGRGRTGKLHREDALLGIGNREIKRGGATKWDWRIGGKRTGKAQPGKGRAKLLSHLVQAEA